LPGRSLCQSYPAEYSWNDGYGFNEGWADYWQGSDLSSLDDCLTKISATDFRQESVVARDLEALQVVVGSCAGIPADTSGDALIRARRSAMFDVLSGAGHEKIHSDADFRAAFKARFPACSMPTAGTYASPISPASIAVHRVEVAGFRRLAINDHVTIVGKNLDSIPAQIKAAEAAASHIAVTTELADRSRILVQSAYLRGQQASLTLLQQQLKKEAQKPTTLQVLMTAAGQQARTTQVTAFDRKIRTIEIQALTEQRSALQAADATAHADDISAPTKEIQSLQAGNLEAASALLGDADDGAEQAMASKPTKSN
jgi:hypothetical protein